jgi:hypothetical protein
MRAVVINSGVNIPSPAMMNQKTTDSRPVAALRAGMSRCVSRIKAIEAVPNIANDSPIPIFCSGNSVLDI